MAKISVCVATVRATTLRATISAMRRQTLTDWELIVVGQGNADAMHRAVEEASGDDARVRYLHADRYGLSAARNIAFGNALGDVLACTDDDCEPRSDWLSVVSGCFDADPALGLVGGSLLAPPPAKRWVPSSCLSVIPAEVLYDPAVTLPPAPPGFNCVGGNLAVRRSAAERAGRFDELLGAGAKFLSGEDTDYLHRLECAGVKMMSTPRSVVFHTYGRRYGWREMPRYWHGQGVGHGAIAAKLTLRGDPRGAEEVSDWLRGYPTQWIATREPGHLPRARHLEVRRMVSDPIRLAFAATTYRRCLREYLIDDEGLLRPRPVRAAQQP